MSTVQESPQTTRGWLWAIPVVTSAYDTVTSAYEGARDRNVITRFAIGTVESSVKLAGRYACPIVHRLESTFEKPLSAVDAFALKKLQQVESSYPVIKKPTDEVLTQGKEMLVGTWEKSSERVATYPGVKLIGSGIAVGSTMIESTIKLGQQGINGTIGTGRRSINAANHLVGRGVDQCLNATEAVVKYLLPEEQDKSTMDEPLLISNTTDSAKNERSRRRQQHRRRHEMHKARRLRKTWAGRLERAEDIICDVVDQTTDRVYGQSVQKLEFVKTLRIAKAAATAYELLQEYLEEAGDKLKTINPLKSKEKKINLLTDSDDEDKETALLDSVKALATSVQTTATGVVNTMVDLPVHLAVRAYQMTVETSVYLAGQGRAISVRVYDEGKGMTFETVITKVTGLKDATVAIVKSYLGFDEVSISKSSTSPLLPPTSKQSFTVVVTPQHIDTPAIEDIHHSDSDHSGSSSDDGSSDDEPEHKSEDDD